MRVPIAVALTLWSLMKSSPDQGISDRLRVRRCTVAQGLRIG